MRGSDGVAVVLRASGAMIEHRVCRMPLRLHHCKIEGVARRDAVIIEGEKDMLFGAEKRAREDGE